MRTIFLKPGEYKNGAETIKVAMIDVKQKKEYNMLDPEMYVMAGICVLPCMFQNLYHQQETLRKQNGAKGGRPKKRRVKK